MTLTLLDQYPYHIAAFIGAICLLLLALLYPATITLFRIKFNFVKGKTLMQFWRRPNILARILFYSTTKAVRYVGNNRRWHTFPDMKRVTSKRMINFLHGTEYKSHIDSRRRLVKKERG